MADIPDAAFESTRRNEVEPPEAVAETPFMVGVREPVARNPRGSRGGHTGALSGAPKKLTTASVVY